VLGLSVGVSETRTEGTNRKTNMLTDTAIKNAKPSSAPKKIADGGGLHLLLQPTGSKLWRQAYRWQGKQRTAYFGVYPDVSLAVARSKREDLKRLLRDGHDPAAIKVEAKAQKAAEAKVAGQTFSVTAAEWWAIKIVGEGRAPSTLRHLQWALDALNAGIGKKPLAEIEPPELLAVLRKAAANGTHEKASRMRSLAGSVFRYGIACGYCKRDPSSDLRGALTANQSTTHPAVTDPDGVRKLMRALDGVTPPLVRTALKLLALTAVRPGELIAAEWSEFNGSVWTIPEHKTKMRREHRVPLSAQALALLTDLRKVTGNRLHLFASGRINDQNIDKSVLNRALKRVGFGGDIHVPHGFRSTFSSIANESGKWSEDAIELQLAHVDKNTVRRSYNRGDRWQERVDMMAWWGKQLHKMKSAVQ
jgi:integrase